MTVALVVWWFDRFGGMERHVTELAGALRRAGVDVCVISQMPVPRSNCYRQQVQREGVRLICPSLARWAASGGHHFLKGHGRVHSAWAGEEELVASSLLDQWLAGVLDAEHPDVVHVHGCRLDQTWVNRWAQLRGIPSVYTEHTAVVEFGGPFEVSGPELAMAATVLCCVSEDARRQMQTLLPQTREIAIAHHIVREPGLKRTHSASSFEFLCSARLEAHKGLDVLLRAFEGVNAVLTIAGEGSLRSLPSNGRVRFVGKLSPEAMTAAMHRADALVLASRTEGLPLVIIEAMACGLPVVATKVGGIPEVIHHGVNGLLIPPDDSESLAAAMELLVRDSSLRTRLGKAARRCFEEGPWNEPAVLRETFALYERSLDRVWVA